MKIAIIHDWLTVHGGAEKVLTSILSIYPDADIFTLVDFLSDEDREVIINGKNTTTSFIQGLPFSKKKFRNYLPLFPLAIEQFDLSKYDVVLSFSHAVAKGVMIAPHQLHISYVHSPIRYAWDMYHPYMKEHKVKGLKALVLKYTLHKLRIWDVISSNRVDYFIGNSSFIASRIYKYYRRKAEVIFPPVDIKNFALCENKKDYYFTAARLVPYKKVKLIVEAFNENGKQLKVAGIGEQYEEIKRIAKNNIEILGYCSDSEMIKHMQEAKAFVYVAFEDFGIVPVEAMGCGTPVITYGKGGVLDTVIDGKTGVYFNEQTIESLNNAILKFEDIKFIAKDISVHANNFSSQRFTDEFQLFVDEKINEFKK